jgi:hypothetical protein
LASAPLVSGDGSYERLPPTLISDERLWRG